MMEEKRYYAIQQQGRKAELAIFGPIRPISWEDNDVTAWNILQELRELDADEIHVHINSPGGSVGEAFAIYNVLREHPARVTTYADGFVASAAIYPFLAGERRVANPVSAFYFHPVQMDAYGGPDELRKAADTAELLTEQGIKAFEAAGVKQEDAKALVARDDFAAPEEMVELGVATELGQQDDAENASQSILPMVAQLLRERRERKARELAGLQKAVEVLRARNAMQEAEADQQKRMAEDLRDSFQQTCQGMTLTVLPSEENPVGILGDGVASDARRCDEPREAAADAQQKTERPGLRGLFDGMLRDLVQGTPREGAGAPIGLANDPALRGDREPGGKPDNRLGAWLGLRAAE